MFIVAANPQFTHTVKILVPSDGGHLEQSLKVTFKVIDSDEEQAERHDLNTIAGSIAFCKEVVVSLDDLVDAEDKPVVYSDQLRDRLLKVPYIRTPIARAYYDAMTKATVGN
jgi:hypothetical protein